MNTTNESAPEAGAGTTTPELNGAASIDDQPQPAPTELELAQTKAKESEQKYLYLYADFENYKKRTIKERQDLVKFGWESTATELLQVIDNLERALQFAKPEANDANLLQGLQMVAQQFKTALEKNGMAIIPTLNQTFNPDLHEAVAQKNSTEPASQIIEEHQKGYTLHGRLLRASRVVVSQGPAAT